MKACGIFFSVKYGTSRPSLFKGIKIFSVFQKAVVRVQAQFYEHFFWLINEMLLTKRERRGCSNVS